MDGSHLKRAKKADVSGNMLILAFPVSKCYMEEDKDENDTLKAVLGDILNTFIVHRVQVPLHAGQNMEHYQNAQLVWPLKVPTFKK